MSSSFDVVHQPFYVDHMCKAMLYTFSEAKHYSHLPDFVYMSSLWCDWVVQSEPWLLVDAISSTIVRAGHKPLRLFQ